VFFFILVVLYVILVRGFIPRSRYDILINVCWKFLFILLSISFAMIAYFSYMYYTQVYTVNGTSNLWRSSEKTRGKRFDLSVPLETAYNGGSYTLKVQRQKICDVCHGHGTEHPEDVTKCPKCKGKGYRLVRQMMGPFQMQVEEPCDQCEGQGIIFKSKCSKCGGKKHFHGEDDLTVQIPVGMPEGYQILFQEASDELVGYTPGDVIVYARTDSNSRFERQGDDLHTAITITLLEALVGTTIKIEHLDGRIVTYQKENVSYHNEIITIANEGMPHLNSYHRGNLYVKLFLEFPDFVTSEQKEELEKLLTKIDI